MRNMFRVLMVIAAAWMTLVTLRAQSTPNGWALVSASTVATCVANPTTTATLCAVTNDGAYVSVSGAAFSKVAVGAVAVVSPSVVVGDLVKNGGGGLLVDAGTLPPPPAPPVFTTIACPTASLTNTAGLAGGSCTIK